MLWRLIGTKKPLLCEQVRSKINFESITIDKNPGCSRAEEEQCLPEAARINLGVFPNCVLIYQSGSGSVFAVQSATTAAISNYEALPTLWRRFHRPRLLSTSAAAHLFASSPLPPSPASVFTTHCACLQITIELWIIIVRTSPEKL